MATVEALPTTVNEPAAESAPAAPVSDKTEVAVKGNKKKSNPKKTQAKNSSKPRAAPAHPTYIEMIGEAITSLKERTGSSQYAIGKYIEEKHKAHLPSNFNKMLLVQLRKFSASGKLTKVKNSYKLPAPIKKIAATVPVKANKPAAKTKTVASKSKSAKPKVKVAVKPKAKIVAKPKKAVAQTTKPKAAVKVSKPKPKTVAAKPSSRPAKAAKTSVNDAPGKKAVVAKKPVAPKKAALAKKAKSVKAAAKAPAAKTTKAVKAKK